LVDDTGKLRIAGFGLSMLLAEADDVMFNSMDMGNMRWVAPEFVAPDLDAEGSEEDWVIQLPQKPTKAGDVYSFGCVMMQVCWIVIIPDRVRHS
jgi:serine/threonine protein kinase